jgi:uncharacterized protein
MKKSILILGAIAISIFIQAQNLTGKWSGVLNSNGRQYEIVFNISHSGENYSSTMDSPLQNFFGFKTTSTEFKDSLLTIRMDNANMEFQGKLLKNNKFVGIFTQLDDITLLELGKEKINLEKPLVKLPRRYHSFSYSIDTIQLKNNSLAIQTMPIKKGKCKSVVINCDDANKYSCKLKNELIDHLTSNGFSVICIQNSDDMQPAIDFLADNKSINTKRISTLQMMNDKSIKFSLINAEKIISRQIAMTENKVKTFNKLTNWMN